jgi:hypothetical protein
MPNNLRSVDLGEEQHFFLHHRCFIDGQKLHRLVVSKSKRQIPEPRGSIVLS